MTVDQFHAHLQTIRRRQGTRHPLVRVVCGGTEYRGRLARTDSDPEHRRRTDSPYGIVVLEGLGLGRDPETIVQIAAIPDGGLADLDAA